MRVLPSSSDPNSFYYAYICIAAFAGHLLGTCRRSSPAALSIVLLFNDDRQRDVVLDRGLFIISFCRDEASSAVRFRQTRNR